MLTSRSLHVKKLIISVCCLVLWCLYRTSCKKLNWELEISTVIESGFINYYTILTLSNQTFHSFSSRWWTPVFRVFIKQTLWLYMIFPNVKVLEIFNLLSALWLFAVTLLTSVRLLWTSAFMPSHIYSEFLIISVSEGLCIKNTFFLTQSHSDLYSLFCYLPLFFSNKNQEFKIRLEFVTVSLSWRFKTCQVCQLHPVAATHNEHKNKLDELSLSLSSHRSFWLARKLADNQNMEFTVQIKGNWHFNWHKRCEEIWRLFSVSESELKTWPFLSL